jgi:alanine racemase
VSAANPGRDDPGSAPRVHSAPLIQVSASAIAHNCAVALRALPPGARAVGDLRADAWGHGASTVERGMRSAGVRRFVMEDTRASRGMTGLGPAEQPTLDPPTVYGLPGGTAGTRAAMRLTGTVLSTKRLLTGEGVSYGYTYRAAADTHVALVSGGYAQGIVRALGGRVSLGFGDLRFPVVGRVAMDVCVVEIADADVQRGDEVVFFGDTSQAEPDISEWVTATGMSAAEIVTAVGLRAQREEVA